MQAIANHNPATCFIANFWRLHYYVIEFFYKRSIQVRNEVLVSVLAIVYLSYKVNSRGFELAKRRRRLENILADCDPGGIWRCFASKLTRSETIAFGRSKQTLLVLNKTTKLVRDSKKTRTEQRENVSWRLKFKAEIYLQRILWVFFWYYQLCFV